MNDPVPQPSPDSYAERERLRQRDPMVGGIFLVVLGLALLVAQFSPDLGLYVVLIIGLGLLAMFAVTRAYGLLVGGSIVTGVGVGVVLASKSTGELAGAAVLLSLAGGFLFIWLASYALRMRERHYWALIPAAVIGSIGTALLLGENAADILSYWPAILVVLGIILIVAAFLRREGASAID